MNSNDINAGSHQGMFPMSAASTNANGVHTAANNKINISSCPWPGTGGKTTFNDSSIPNSKSWAGANTAKPLTNISESGGVVSFCFIDCGAPCTPPSQQATNLTSSGISDNQMTIGWTRGNGTGVIVVARENSAVNANPTSGISYSASSVFGSGNQTGTDNYVVYKGTGTNVTINNLKAGTTYHYAVYEYFVANNCYKVPGLLGNVTTTGETPCTYCTPNATTNDATGITNVTFGTINNTTGSNAAYSDYTSISTTIYKGHTYDLSVSINTSGNYTVKTRAWIDWNHNCVFDSGEMYDLGSATNVTSGLTSNSPLSITVPETAQSGFTTMRIRSVYGSTAIPTPCDNQNYSEAEDYSLNITTNTAPTILLSTTAINFGQIEVGQVSENKNYTILGVNLTSNITITAPTGFQISKTANSGFGSSLTLEQSAGQVPETNIYVRFTPTAQQTYTGAILHTSTGATSKNLTVGETGIVNTYNAPRDLEGHIENNKNVVLNWFSPEMNESFEYYENFALNFGSWTQHDIDNSATYSIEGYSFNNANYTGSFILFNPLETNPPLSTNWQAYSGSKYIACFAAINGPNNDWLVSPKIRAKDGEFIRFRAKSITDQYGKERIKVGISTTGTQTTDFTIVSPGSYIEVPTSWTEYSYPISAYNGSTIYFAINCVSDDSFALLIDDIRVTNASGSTIKNLTSADTEIPGFANKKTTPDNMPLTDNLHQPKSFASYNVYRDGTLVGSSANFEYIDNNVPVGNHNYYVKAVYANPNGLSPESNTISVNIKNQYTVNFSVVGGNGNLTALVGGSQITSGAAVVQGSNVDFTAYPNSNFRVKQWKLNGNVITGNTSNSYAINNIAENATVTVEFEAIPPTTYTVNFSVVGGNGTLTALVGGSQISSGAAVVQGSNVDFTAYPNSNFRVKQWKLNGNVITGNTSNSYAINNIAENATVTVEFDQETGVFEQNATILVFPNPSNSIFTISVNNEYQAEVFDISGKKVLSQVINSENNIINLYSNSNGIYFIHLVGETTHIFKVVKN